MLQASFSAAMADANGGTISQALKAGAIGFARAGLEQMGGGAGPGGGSGNGQLVFQLDAAAKSMGLERGSSLKDLFVSEAVARLRVAERKAQANINRSESTKIVPQSQQQALPETNWQRFKSCTAEHYGLDSFDHSDNSMGEFVAENPLETPSLIGATPWPKPFVLPGASPVTNVGSRIAQSLPRISMGRRVLGTASALRMVARANVVLAVGFLAYDATSIGMCMARN